MERKICRWVCSSTPAAASPLLIIGLRLMLYSKWKCFYAKSKTWSTVKFRTFSKLVLLSISCIALSKYFKRHKIIAVRLCQCPLDVLIINASKRPLILHLSILESSKWDPAVRKNIQKCKRCQTLVKLWLIYSSLPALYVTVECLPQSIKLQTHQMLLLCNANFHQSIY